MFDHDNQFPLLPFNGDYPLEAETEPDRVDSALNGVTRFAALFAIGITVTLLVRWMPPLLPFYWIGAIATLLALALPAYLSRSARLLALAIALAVSLCTGWYDQLAYTSQQFSQAVNARMQAVLK